MQFNKKIYNVCLCFLNVVYAYLLGRDTSSAMNPFICEISQEESYKVVQDERDYSEYVQMYIIKKCITKYSCCYASIIHVYTLYKLIGLH